MKKVLLVLFAGLLFLACEEPMGSTTPISYVSNVSEEEKETLRGAGIDTEALAIDTLSYVYEEDILLTDWSSAATGNITINDFYSYLWSKMENKLTYINRETWNGTGTADFDYDSATPNTTETLLNKVTYEVVEEYDLELLNNVVLKKWDDLTPLDYTSNGWVMYKATETLYKRRIDGFRGESGEWEDYSSAPPDISYHIIKETASGLYISWIDYDGINYLFQYTQEELNNPSQEDFEFYTKQ